MPHPVRIVILTPIRAEYDAVRAQLREWQDQVVGGWAYAFGYFEGIHHKYEIRLRETGPGNTVVALATQQVIDQFQPTVILLIGIAGSVKDADIGDVVIGTKAYGYESSKETDDGSLSRPNVLPYSTDLVEMARTLSRSNDWRIRAAGGATDANIYFGPIASGDKVIASTKSPLYGYLKERYNDTLALEMESIGFAKAVQPYRSVHALNIRAVSDLLDHKSEGDEKARQRMAAERAAAFAFELLYRSDLSSFITPDMEIKDIVKEVYALFFPAALKEIGSDFAGATNNEIRELWKRVKPLFIKEVEKLARDPENEDRQGAVRTKLADELEENATLQQEITALLEAIKKQAPAQASISVINSKNVVAGSTINVGGDFRVGDDKTTYYGNER